MVAQFVFTIFVAFTGAGGPYFICDIFPVHVRTAGVGISYNIAQALFGGTAAVINGGLAMSNPVLPCLWSIAVGGLSTYYLYNFEQLSDKRVKEATNQASQIAPSV